MLPDQAVQLQGTRNRVENGAKQISSPGAKASVSASSSRSFHLGLEESGMNVNETEFDDRFTTAIDLRSFNS